MFLLADAGERMRSAHTDMVRCLLVLTAVALHNCKLAACFPGAFSSLPRETAHSQTYSDWASLYLITQNGPGKGNVERFYVLKSSAGVLLEAEENRESIRRRHTRSNRFQYMRAGGGHFASNVYNKDDLTSPRNRDAYSNGESSLFSCRVGVGLRLTNMASVDGLAPSSRSLSMLSDAPHRVRRASFQLHQENRGELLEQGMAVSRESIPSTIHDDPLHVLKAKNPSSPRNKGAAAHRRPKRTADWMGRRRI